MKNITDFFWKLFY